MAASPQWKVYDAQGVYQAACKEIEAAAALIGFYGDGATIRADHAKSFTVWTEGEGYDGVAFESYDAVAETAYGLLAAWSKVLKGEARGALLMARDGHDKASLEVTADRLREIADMTTRPPRRRGLLCEELRQIARELAVISERMP